MAGKDYVNRVDVIIPHGSLHKWRIVWNSRMTLDVPLKKARSREFGAQTHFHDLLLAAHRLSNALADNGVFRSNEISVSEWAVLSALQKRREMHLRDIVRESGVSRQRINKVLRELDAKDLVTVGQTADGDKRRRVVALTGKAARTCSEIRTGLDALLDEALGTTTLAKRRGVLRRLAIAARLVERFGKTLKSQAKNLPDARSAVAVK
jgi:DNA-binding MarR family transcriptional regulator